VKFSCADCLLLLLLLLLLQCCCCLQRSKLS
jgi:hypothetical protein